jgi:probable phosphoglycerate mutase
VLLVCVRHLPTEWNARGLLQGRRDTALIDPDAATLAGIRRDRERIDRLGPFDCVLTSTLRRTHRTAELYGFRDCTVEPLLDECDFGEWEGRSREEMQATLGDRWMSDPRGLVLGESLDDLEARIRKAAAKYSTYGRVLAFAHGSWMRALRSIIDCGDLRDMNRRWIDNGELLVCECDRSGWIVRAAEPLA